MTQGEQQQQQQQCPVYNHVYFDRLAGGQAGGQAGKVGRQVGGRAGGRADGQAGGRSGRQAAVAVADLFGMQACRPDVATAGLLLSFPTLGFLGSHLTWLLLLLRACPGWPTTCLGGAGSCCLWRRPLQPGLQPPAPYQQHQQREQ